MKPEANPDRDLARLLAEVADTLEPTDRLPALRASTAVAPARSWGWRLAPLAAAAAVVAVIGGITLSQDRTTQDPPASGDRAETGSVALPVYYVGATPQGDRLFREWRTGTSGTDKLSQAVDAAVSGDPIDPDYTTLWPAGTSASAAAYAGPLITVDLTATERGGLLRRPGGMSRAAARLAIQQVVYTAQAALGEGRVPVRLLVDGAAMPLLLGVRIDHPVGNAPVLQTLSRVSLTRPSEGARITDARLDVEGVANAFEATVVCQVLRDGEVVREVALTAEGAGDTRLWPFVAQLDLTGLAPGDYVLRALIEDPSGADPTPYADTRSFTLR